MSGAYIGSPEESRIINCFATLRGFRGFRVLECRVLGLLAFTVYEFLVLGFLGLGFGAIVSLAVGSR